MVEVNWDAATIAGDRVTLASGVHRITRQSRVGEKLSVQTG
jgi:hypothetical protein